MPTCSSRWLRSLLILSVYALGVLGIVASGGSGSGGSDANSACTLEIAAIAPATDGSGDIWVGLLANTADDDYHEVVRLDSSGLAVSSYSIARGTQDSLVGTLAVATDALNAGDVYVGGDFDGGILRLNDDGSMDPGFAVGDGFNGRVNSIVAADDGSGDIYVGGNFSRYDGKLVSGLVRLKSGGLLDDAGFDGSGFDARIHAIERAGDMTGDIYVGGGFSNYKGLPANGIVRLADDGSRRASFVIGDGFTDDANDPASTGLVQAIARAADGTTDVYAGGRFAYYDGSRSNGIARLNDDGSLDRGFDIDINIGAESCLNDSLTAFK